MIGPKSNQNIIYPVLDLIRREIAALSGDLGIASVKLHRNHPIDPETVTSADLFYLSGEHHHVALTLGSTDESTFPSRMTKADYEFCRFFRLNSVLISHVSNGGGNVGGYIIDLYYDKNGLLDRTNVTELM